MKTSFDLKDKLKAFSDNTKKCPAIMRKIIDVNAKAACKAMEQAAKTHTPNSKDGKNRGFNVISNSLMNAWKADYTKEKSSDVLGIVTLTNSMPYAAFVQYGHKVNKHFVPWLYKDGSGTLSYELNHSQPMFGLVVGTKTNYVKGVDMISPAIEAFEKTFYSKNKIISMILLKEFGLFK